MEFRIYSVEDLSIKAVFFSCISFEWTVKYNEVGSAELEILYRDGILSSIERGDYLGWSESDRLMRIRTLQVSDGKLVIYGEDALGILEERVNTAYSAKDYEAGSYAVEDNIRDLVSTYVIDTWPCVELGDSAGLTTTYEYYPYSDDTGTILGGAQVPAIPCDIGLRMIHNGDSLVFSCYQPSAVKSSNYYDESFGNMTDLEYTLSDTEYKNVGVVTFSGGTTQEESEGTAPYTKTINFTKTVAGSWNHVVDAYTDEDGNEVVEGEHDEWVNGYVYTGSYVTISGDEWDSFTHTFSVKSAADGYLLVHCSYSKNISSSTVYSVTFTVNPGKSVTFAPPSSDVGYRDSSRPYCYWTFWYYGSSEDAVITVANAKNNCTWSVKDPDYVAATNLVASMLIGDVGVTDDERREVKIDFSEQFDTEGDETLDEFYARAEVYGLKQLTEMTRVTSTGFALSVNSECEVGDLVDVNMPSVASEMICRAVAITDTLKGGKWTREATLGDPIIVKRG